MNKLSLLNLLLAFSVYKRALTSSVCVWVEKKREVAKIEDGGVTPFMSTYTHVSLV